jgi:glycyl-tRNA synthetase beta chain
MAELLLELLSEEIPARMQARAAENLERAVTRRLADARLEFTSAAAYVTPRRLVLVADGLPDKQPDVTEERKGPRVGAPDKAIQGFLGSVGLESPDQCEVRDTGKGEFYFAVIEEKGRATIEVLTENLGDVIRGFDWPKSMRWGARSMRWVRPLKQVLCLFDGAPVPLDLESESVPVSEATRGHRFLAPAPIRVSSFADYRDKLRAAYVMLDGGERRQTIRADAERLAAAEGLTVRADEELLAEAAGLVEWPVALIGTVDEAFMDLPPEVLTSVMRHHQKYLSLTRADGALAPRFVVIANMLADDGGAAMVAGHERVLRARLADAKFFWDQDHKRTLESRVPALDGIIFHAKLGSMGEKVARMQALIAELAPYIPRADVALGERAALLAKADLTAEMVGEFPELQGVMGRYYALHEGARAEVAKAVEEHYAPQGPADRCPTAPLSVAVALADKIDTLVGFFAVGEMPTGSKDPFALRRAALGVIRLIVENGLRIPLRTVFETADLLHAERRGAVTGGLDPAVLLDFLADRLKVHLREKGVRHDLVSAVFALGGEDDLVRLLARVDALKGFVDTEDGEHLLTAYRRAVNIVRIEEKRDGRSYDGEADESLLKEDGEVRLYERLAEVRRLSAPALAREEFAAAMQALALLRKPVDAFFDHVTVNCEDKKLRANRLRLLSQIRATMEAVADFSKIEG